MPLPPTAFAAETAVTSLPDQFAMQLAPRSENQIILPALIQNAGEKTARRYLEFFLVSIRNRNTRDAYGRAVSKFFNWCEMKGLNDLQKIEPLMVAAFIEQETQQRNPQTVKQELAAIKGLFDYLVTGQVIPFNPAASVRGPAYSTDQGKTPVLEPEEARALLDSIPTQTPDGAPYLVGLRDRALIGVMIYTFARVSAVINMTVADYRLQGKRSEAQLHEKGGVFHKVPMHHMAQEYLDAYVEAAGIGDARKSPLFRSAQGKTNTLTENAIDRRAALRAVKRRTKAAGLPEDICCHSWRATGITNFRFNGGTLENAQAIANHKSPRTTKLYDRTRQKITQTEIERINF